MKRLERLLAKVTTVISSLFDWFTNLPAANHTATFNTGGVAPSNGAPRPSLSYCHLQY